MGTGVSSNQLELARLREKVGDCYARLLTQREGAEPGVAPKLCAYK